MSKEEKQIINEILIAIGYTLDAIQPSKMHDNREYEAKEKAVRQLERTSEMLNKIDLK